MVALTWLRGLLAHRRGRLLSTAVGVAVGVALLASIGTFLSSTTAKMTDRARSAGSRSTGRSRPSTGADPARVLGEVAHRPGVRRALPVGFAATTGLQADHRRLHADDGPGQGPRPARRATPAPSRARSASSPGHGDRRAAGPADRRQPARPARRPRHHRRARRRRGAPSASTASSTCPRPTRSSSRSAPRPAPSRRRRPTTSCCCPQRALRSRRARRDRRHAGPRPARPPAPRQPQRRLHPGHRRRRATSRRRLAGAGLVGDNLGTALDEARQDALYAAAAVPVPRRARRDPRRPGHRARSPPPGADRRRRDAALLRTRGASTRQLVRIGAGRDARWPARSASRSGSAPRCSSASVAFGTASFGASTLAAALWAGGAALAGLVIAAALDRPPRLARCAQR